MRRPFAWALDFAESAFFRRRVEYQGATLGKGRHRLDAVYQFDASARRIVQYHALAATGMLQRLDR
ncbi:hypothetical protein D3C75_1012630 [compost metagenome]